MKRYLTVMAILLAALIALAVFTALFYPNAEENATARIGIDEGRSVFNVLLLGRDSVAGLCDVITIASLDMANGKVNIMQIPRDTYFDYGNGNHNKINGAPYVLGVSAFADELSKALGIKIDCYLCLDLDTLKQMLDLVSGIEVYVPQNMDYDDPYQNLSIHLKAGNNVLSSSEAIGFLRYRAGYLTGDIGRLDAQKLFLNAFFKKMSQQKNPLLFYNLFKIVSEQSESNINEQDIISVGLKLKGQKNMDVFYMTASGEAVQSDKSGAWYYILSRPTMNDLLYERFGADKKDFDKNNKFVDKRVKSFYDIYEKYYDYKVYSTDDIENNQININ